MSLDDYLPTFQKIVITSYSDSSSPRKSAETSETARPKTQHHIPGDSNPQQHLNKTFVSPTVTLICHSAVFHHCHSDKRDFLIQKVLNIKSPKILCKTGQWFARTGLNRLQQIPVYIDPVSCASATKEQSY